MTTFSGKTITYDNKGNITDFTTVGKFGYNIVGKPYMVSDITPYGTEIAQRLQTITYNGMLRPATISENNYIADLIYNSDSDRVKIHIKKGTVDELVRYYIGGQYESDAGVAGTKERLYLGGDAYSAVAVYTKEGAGVRALNYICRDYLGSITHITDAAGNLKQELSYDTWGRLRNPINQTLYAVDANPSLLLGRGYTGHEYLPMFGLINMNARLYDPAVGIKSLISASKSEKVGYYYDKEGYRIDVKSHSLSWMEIGANKKAEKYFREKYGVKWEGYKFNWYFIEYPNNLIKY